MKKEPFPAVTVCYPNTWKWPGIINLLSQWGQSNPKFHINEEGLNRFYYLDTFFKMGKIRAWAFRDHDYTPWQICDDCLCPLVNGFFKTPEEQKQGQFILYMLGQMGQLSNSTQRAEFERTLNLTRRWKESESLAFADIKADICQLSFLNCDQVENVCQTYPAMNTSGSSYSGLEFWNPLNTLWFFTRFWTPRTLLQMQVYQAYNEKKLRYNLSMYLGLYFIDLELSGNVTGYNLWHYLKGIYASPEDDLVKIAMTAAFTDFCFHSKLNDSGEYLGGSWCNFDHESLKSYLTLIDQPKAHGNDLEDFVLIPFCSFGSEPLTACSDFHKSIVLYQDYTCFTFEHPRETRFTDAKFQFVLNIRENMPKDKPLSVKVLLHEQGTIPDVLEIDSASQEIYAENDFTKIGISVGSTEVTDNFRSMPFSKRNCYLNDKLESYSRMGCLTKTIFQEAGKKCNCTPWTMGELLPETVRYCNLSGAHCFREFTNKAKDKIGEDICPKMCNYKLYQMLTPDHVRFDPFEHGEDFIDYLSQNPMRQLLEGSTQDQDWLIPSWEAYVKDNSKAFSMVQLYFHDPRVSVTTKDAKVTLPDMVSNIGGTVGIFLGLSMLSVLDFLIHFSRIIKRKYVDFKKRFLK